MSALADITNYPCWITHHQSVAWHTLCDYTSGSHHRVVTDFNPAHHGGIGPDTHTSLDQRWCDFPICIKCTGNSVIGKCNIRPNEYIILDRYAVIYRHAILDFASVADFDRVVNVNILGDNTMMSNFSIFPNLNIYPNFRTLTYTHRFRDMRGGMNKGFSARAHIIQPGKPAARRRATTSVLWLVRHSISRFSPSRRSKLAAKPISALACLGQPTRLSTKVA